MDENKAYELGKDSKINGANTTNCSFNIFGTKRFTKAWEKGRKDAMTNPLDESKDKK